MTRDRLVQLLDFDPETRTFRWRDTSYPRKAGRAGWRQQGGTWAIMIDGGTYTEARLAHFWEHGRWPIRRVDNTSGVTGISRHGSGWGARRTIDGERMWVGVFPTIEKAREALR